MARKPVKKRKQQRTSVKRKTKFFKAKPVFVKKPNVSDPSCVYEPVGLFTKRID